MTIDAIIQLANDNGYTGGDNELREAIQSYANSENNELQSYIGHETSSDGKREYWVVRFAIKGKQVYGNAYENEKDAIEAYAREKTIFSAELSKPQENTLHTHDNTSQMSCDEGGKNE